MSKTRNKERDEREHFRGQIKKLESENRQLKKRLRALDKQAHLYEDIVDAVAEEIVVTDNKCQKCQIGIIRLLDLKHAKFLVCNNEDCQDRKKA